MSLAERQAQLWLRRYGVIFRALLARESCAIAWYEMLLACRRLEARGEIRGGRFVSGFAGEQYALPQAMEALRAQRHLAPVGVAPGVAAADPLNLAGIILPGERIPAQRLETAAG
ncbi:MAG: Lhr family helicase [Terriglobales bacterium]